MKTAWLGTILLATLLCLPPISAAPITRTPAEATPTAPSTPYQATVPLTASIHIARPVAGYAYFFNLKPVHLPRLTQGALVVGRQLIIDTVTDGIDHAKFVATRKVTGWTTTAWDYSDLDGTGTSLAVTTGIYTVTAIGYDADDHEIASDAVKVFYLKLGNSDFGVWAHTKYDNGMTVTTPLNIGITDFGSMLTTGTEHTYAVSLQKHEDSALRLRFSRTTIMNDTHNVVQVSCGLSTTADTTKAYEVSLEVRFPFDTLSGDTSRTKNVSVFSASLGYRSTSGTTPGLNNVNTTLYFGRENLSDPRIFRLRLQPENVDERSSVTYFSRYQTVDTAGQERFFREFSVAFTPATDLTITTIPREAKVSYDFGRSAGMPTSIAFRAEGGLLDDIVQTFHVDPLPQYMYFDLTILGSREFIYQSDRAYNISYALDSDQNGNLVTLQAQSLPTSIHATWGVDFGLLSGHSFQSFLDINMSAEIAGLIITQANLTTPLVNITHFPRHFRVDSQIDLQAGTGNITLHRNQPEPRTVALTLAYDHFTISKSFILANEYLTLAWQLDVDNGTGHVAITRDNNATLQYHTELNYQGWTFAHDMTLTNPHVSFAWTVDRLTRKGHLVFTRDPTGDAPTFSSRISYIGWALQNTLQLNNPSTDLYWDLADASDHHAVINLTTGGGLLLTDTLSLIDNGNTILNVSIGLQTDNHFQVSWDNINGTIKNFQWSGHLIKLTNLALAVDLPGDLLTIQGAWQMGSGGTVDLTINKPVTVTFADVQTPRFQILGYVSFAATRHLTVRWSFGSLGYLRVYTNGQPLGDAAGFKIFYDPSNSGNYQYGFNATTTSFLNANFNITWNTNLPLPRVWCAGTLPLNWLLNWNAAVMLNSVWYQRDGWIYT